MINETSHLNLIVLLYSDSVWLDLIHVLTLMLVLRVADISGLAPKPASDSSHASSFLIMFGMFGVYVCIFSRCGCCEVFGDGVWEWCEKWGVCV